jgi:hypothetical protein
MKKIALFSFFVASLILTVCSLAIFAYNISVCEVSSDTPAIVCIAIVWVGMCGMLTYTAYRDLKRGY